MNAPESLTSAVTYFRDHAAASLTTETTTLADLARRILATSAPAKSDLPWLKLATFGDTRTAKNSLRNNANVLTVTGVEADYDQSAVTVDQAAERLRAAGLAALIYTSPSHMDDLPRWRVLCPFSAPRPPADRADFVARLNGVLGGILSVESFTLSQAFYFGHLDGADDFRAVLIDGVPLDARPDLPTVYPPRRAAAPLALPVLPPAATPDDRAAATLRAAVAAFDEPGSDLGRHQHLLAATNALAPFVLSGHLDADQCHDDLEAAMSASGRDANPGEVAGALAGALRHAKPYEPPTGGVEFGTLPAGTVADDPDAWRAMLQRTKDDGIKGNLLNATVALRHAPAWRGVFRLDAFANRIRVCAPPPWHTGPFDPVPLRDVDALSVAVWMQDAGIAVSSAVAHEAVVKSAESNRFHPVRDYLAGLRWDGEPRIAGWLADYCGAEDTAFNRAISAKFMLSMVARVMRPGCKVDTVLILEGRQGLRKSSALAALARGWFVDHMPDLASKDAVLQTHGVVLVEFAELDKLRRAERARTKAFISTAVDRIRVPYGRGMDDYPRQCVFAGTVNPGAVGYLDDETGNRRFWPVACGVGWPERRQIDLAGLRAVADQLWAEAAARFANGETWWIEDHGVEEQQETATAARMAGDIWEPLIVDWLADKAETDTNDILERCIRKPAERRSHGDMIRVGTIMSRMVEWNKKRVRVAGTGQTWRYVRGAGVVALPAPELRALSGLV